MQSYSLYCPQSFIEPKILSVQGFLSSCRLKRHPINTKGNHFNHLVLDDVNNQKRRPTSLQTTNTQKPDNRGGITKHPPNQINNRNQLKIDVGEPDRNKGRHLNFLSRNFLCILKMLMKLKLTKKTSLCASRIRV